MHARKYARTHTEKTKRSTVGLPINPPISGKEGAPKHEFHTPLSTGPSWARSFKKFVNVPWDHSLRAFAFSFVVHRLICISIFPVIFVFCSSLYLRFCLNRDSANAYIYTHHSTFGDVSGYFPTRVFGTMAFGKLALGIAWPPLNKVNRSNLMQP